LGFVVLVDDVDDVLVLDDVLLEELVDVLLEELVDVLVVEEVVVFDGFAAQTGTATKNATSAATERAAFPPG
jgi:hypothetical protein